MITPARSPRRQVLRDGLLASSIALAVVVVARVVLDRPGLVEVLSDNLLRYLPVAVFDVAVQALGPAAKALLYLSIGGGVLLTGSLLALRARRVRTPRGPWMDALLIAAAAVLFVELLVLPLAQAGFLGAASDPDPVAFHGVIVVAALAYAAALVVLREGLDVHEGRGVHEGRDAVPEIDQVDGSPARPASQRIPRRAALARLVTGAGVVSLGVAALPAAAQILVSTRRGRDGTRMANGPGPSHPPGGFGPTAAVTAVGDFYQVNKDLLATEVDGTAWRLTVDGLVDRPYAYSLAELEALPAHEAHRTLECISLDIVRGDDLIGNQLWRGVRIGDLLDRAGVQPTASFVLWEAADGFTESLPLEVARHPDSWIAYRMGGAPLTVEHGFPARVLIPGRFGMKQPKWLTRMQLADHDEPGYWQQRGWDREAVVRVMSRIDEPRNGTEVAAGVPFRAYGIANSGDRGIDRVEVSADGGASWIRAALEDVSAPGLGPLTWVRWRADITLASPAPARLVVRATDGAGGTQEERESAPLPSGSTGWHAVRLIAV